jgi:hypothetical protein
VGQWIAVRLGSTAVSVRTDQPARVTVGSLGSIELRFV